MIKSFVFAASVLSIAGASALNIEDSLRDKVKGFPRSAAIAEEFIQAKGNELQLRNLAGKVDFPAIFGIDYDKLNVPNHASGADEAFALSNALVAYLDNFFLRRDLSAVQHTISSRYATGYTLNQGFAYRDKDGSRNDNNNT